MVKDLLLELGRLALAAVVSYLLTDQVIANLLPIADEAVKLQVAGLLTVVLKAIDRALHESKTAVKGLARF